MTILDWMCPKCGSNLAEIRGIVQCVRAWCDYIETGEGGASK